MSSINEVIDAVSATITAATGWQCTDNWDNPPVPCVLLYPDDMGTDGSYWQSMNRGVVKVPIVANVLVSSTNNVGQSRKLNDAISAFGATSIPQAIAQNPTLGTDPNEATAGAAATMTATVSGVSEYGPTATFAGTRVIQAKVHIEVMTRGDR